MRVACNAMTTVQQALERIDVGARELDPRRTALTIVAAVPFVIGFVVAIACRAVWTVVAWLWTAALVGWETAGGVHGKVRGFDGPA